MCTASMSEFDKLKGTWIHSLPWDSDDYLAEYTISGSESNPVVEAFDTNDGEKFNISEIRWEGSRLIFKSFMPSTSREGINEFSLNKNGQLDSKFTFTVYENLQRKNT